MEKFECEFSGLINGDEQLELAFVHLPFGDIHVKITDRVALYTLPLGFIAFNILQAGNAMPRQEAVQS